jgi:hypothetical protein
VIEFLRLLGMLNAAVWLGATVFYVFAAGPFATSEQVSALLGQQADYFTRVIEHLLAARFFKLQFICAMVAVFHVAAEWLYLGRVPKRAHLALIAFLVGATLFGGLAVQPRLMRWNMASHAVNFTLQQRLAAARTYRAWHAGWVLLSFATLAGLGVYYWRVGTSSSPGRFVGATQFRS